uniref:Uncharacterized protein n=1 Tax=Arundo donax TaxID=35708 RepID=A0A0A9AT64_ARUDO
MHDCNSPSATIAWSHAAASVARNSCSFTACHGRGSAMVPLTSELTASCRRSTQRLQSKLATCLAWNTL